MHEDKHNSVRQGQDQTETTPRKASSGQTGKTAVTCLYFPATQENFLEGSKD
jgi:hypothetical protein